MSTVSLHNVRKVYDNGRVAVAGASFEIAAGELVVLVGPSGCGKSTLLRMIAGLETITSGDLAIAGVRVNDLAPRDRDIAMVFQNYALYPHMTVAENLAFGMKLRGTARAEIDRRVGDAARMLGIEALLKLRPAELSGGQRQRVAVGRALVRQPKVFLLDEPLSNLDAKLRLTMRAEIARLHRTLGTTMVYVTHDQVEAMTLGHRIVVMSDGHVQQIDTPMRIYDKPVNLFVAGFLGSPAMNLLRGRVVRDRDARVDLGAASLPLGAVPLPDGADVVVGVRPEDLMPADVAPSGMRLEATLELVEPVGNECFLNLDLGGQALVARVPPRFAPAPGSRMTFAIDPARLHYFDPRGGRRIDA